MRELNSWLLNAGRTSPDTPTVHHNENVAPIGPFVNGVCLKDRSPSNSAIDKILSCPNVHCIYITAVIFWILWGYPLVVKHGNEKSPLGGGFTRKITDKWSVLHCHVWIPEGIPWCTPIPANHKRQRNRMIGTPGPSLRAPRSDSESSDSMEPAGGSPWVEVEMDENGTFNSLIYLLKWFYTYYIYIYMYLGRPK